MLHKIILENTKLFGFILSREASTPLGEFVRKHLRFFDTLFSTEGLILVIIPVLLLILFGIYALIYRLIRNKIEERDIKLLKTLRPRNIFIIGVAIGLFVIIPFSFSSIYSNNKEIDEFEYEIYKRNSPAYSTEKYENYDSLNSQTKYVYDNYFYSFAGHEFKEVDTILYIVEDSPEELLEYLELNSITYEKVQYNYSDLVFLYTMVRYESIDNDTFADIRFDFSENQVVLYLKDDANILDGWKQYIENGSLVIEEGVWYEIQTYDDFINIDTVTSNQEVSDIDER